MKGTKGIGWIKYAKSTAQWRGVFPSINHEHECKEGNAKDQAHIFGGTACNVIRAVITSYVSYISSALSRERQHTILYNILFSLMDKEQKKKIS